MNDKDKKKVQNDKRKISYTEVCLKDLSAREVNSSEA